MKSNTELFADENLGGREFRNGGVVFLCGLAKLPKHVRKFRAALLSVALRVN